MKTYQERRELVSTRVGEGREVASDGRTVWVNVQGACVARFCPLSREYLREVKGEERTQTVRHEWDRHPEYIPTDWDCFVEEVEHRFSIKIGPEHRPLYVRES